MSAPDTIQLTSLVLLWLDLNSSYTHSSLALPAIHAQMEEDDPIQWEVVSATINENIGSVVDAIHKRRPDVIAATTWLFTHEVLQHILSRVKALLPNTLIALGGPEFLGDNEPFLRKNEFVDCVFRGEGEESFPQWLSCVDIREKWNNVSGICYIDSIGNYVDNGIARVSCFSELIPPEKSPFFNWNKAFVQLETTRGCFNTCAFCVSGREKPVRTLSIDAIRERLLTIRQHGIRDVRVLDRTFNSHPQRARALLNLFAEFAPDMRFHLEIHPALLSVTLKQELERMPSGLLHLEAGIQSLREPVLKLCRRQGKLNEALEGLRFLCALPNMVTHADLIAGLPLYSLSEIFEDVRSLATFGAGEIQLELLKLLPGTEMRERAEELGICYAPLPPYEVLQIRDITTQELQTARLLSRLLDGFYNVDAWREVTKHLIKDDASFLHRFLQYLINIGKIDQPMSLEKRGIILYDFCKEYYPAYLTEVSVAWIEAGMSLKKYPAEKVKTKHQTPLKTWNVLYGVYRDNLRLCYLPADDLTGKGYWFGFEMDIQNPKPVFKAFG